MHDMNTLIQLIADTLHTDMSKLQSDSRLQDIQHWDSLSALRVMSAIENTWGIKIPLYAFLKIDTLQALYELIGIDI